MNRTNALARALCTLSLAFVVTACATKLDRAEDLYRQGDRRAALEIWETIPPENPQHAEAVARIEAVEKERSQLVDRYLRRARYFERQQRIAESMLDYRLALRLKDDEPTLEHVQELARTLVALKKQHRGEFDQAFANGDLAQARQIIDLLETFDPFDPELTLKKSQLDAALQQRINAKLVRGRRYFSDGIYPRAKEAFDEILVLDPTNESARGYLAYIAEIRKNESNGQNGQAKKPSPEIPETDTEIRAEGLYQNALESERYNAPFRAILYDLEALRKNPRHKGAQAHLMRLREKLTPQIEPLVQSGRKAFREEDLQLALDDWNKALLINPSDARVQGYVTRAEKLLEGLERLRTEPSPEVSAQ